MKTAFFEVQEWEKDLLQASFPDALITNEKLTAANASQFTDSEIISTFIYSAIDSNVIDRLSQLKLIATRSTGYDHIDVQKAKSRNITVSYVPEYGSNTVAEHTFALILSLSRRIYQSVNQLKNLNFEHDAIRGTDLFEKTIGLIGMGKIGSNVARIAKGFGMNILVYNRTQNPEMMRELGLKYVDLPQLLSDSDVVTLHLPLNEATKHIINKNNILTMKKSSYLINTARGGLIDTEALLLGLDKGILAGIGMDVLEDEKELTDEVAILSTEFKHQVDLKTLVYDHILINHPKVLITPHNAFNSQEALMRIVQTTVRNIQQFLSNQPINTISL